MKGREIAAGKVSADAFLVLPTITEHEMRHVGPVDARSFCDQLVCQRAYEGEERITVGPEKLEEAHFVDVCLRRCLTEPPTLRMQTCPSYFRQSAENHGPATLLVLTVGRRVGHQRVQITHHDSPKRGNLGILEVEAP